MYLDLKKKWVNVYTKLRERVRSNVKCEDEKKKCKIMTTIERHRETVGKGVNM